MKISKFLFVIFLLFNIPCYAGDIIATKSNSSFQEVAHIDQLQQISVSEVPVTTYTPKNLKSQQQLRFQGRNTSTGAMTFWSTTITDYDTKIVDSEVDENGDYYIIDNLGNKIKTSEQVDTTSLDTRISTNENNISNLQTAVSSKADASDVVVIDNKVNTNTTSIENASKKIKSNTDSIDNINRHLNNQAQHLYNLDRRIDKLENRINKGLASVTAISALKSNPRSNAKAELSVGVGMYRNNSAIATGVVYHVNDNIMVHGGIGYGSEDSTVGYSGATFSLF